MKKIGLWLPSRKNYKREKGEEDSWLLKEVADELASRLKKEIKGKFFNDLNFKEAFVDSGKVWVNDVCMNDLDAFLWLGKIRVGPGSYHLEILKAMRSNVMNSPDAIEICADKFKTQALLKKNKIKVPENLLFNYGYDKVSSHRPINKFLERNKEVLIKPRYGGAGVGIMKVDSRSDLKAAMEYSDKSIHFIEQFIPHKLKDFIGINVINGKFIHGYTKEGDYIVDGWKPYSNRPGGMVVKEATKEQKKIALKVAKVVGLDFFGVDMITDKKGDTYVVDINTFPGLYPEILSKLKVDAIGELVSCVKNKL